MTQDKQKKLYAVGVRTSQFEPYKLRLLGDGRVAIWDREDEAWVHESEDAVLVDFSKHYDEGVCGHFSKQKIPDSEPKLGNPENVDELYAVGVRTDPSSAYKLRKDLEGKINLWTQRENTWIANAEDAVLIEMTGLFSPNTMSYKR